ncbi:MAG: hypothetical protein IJR85_10010 [Synergistaceae bacterium]|nr:hypothetical protein [Synergistaceae bacterium]
MRLLRYMLPAHQGNNYARGVRRRNGSLHILDREENLCTIYGSRPVVCNVNAMYEAFFRDKMTREEFYAMNYEA